jgi:hypothetical protein
MMANTAASAANRVAELVGLDNQVLSEL